MASELKVDKFTGVTTAGSIDVTGEGNSTTTNLQQGLGKVWINFNGESTIASRDTFNVGSITDEGTGDYQLNYTNNMGNANYAPSGMSEADGKVVIDDSNYSSHVTTSSLDVEAKTGGSNIDREVICVTIHGDLA
tara:strand:+ start:319 stop:723 length:405 start_codon:yes stop_codon:yes gene_type:complete